MKAMRDLRYPQVAATLRWASTISQNLQRTQPGQTDGLADTARPPPSLQVVRVNLRELRCAAELGKSMWSKEEAVA